MYMVPCSVLVHPPTNGMVPKPRFDMIHQGNHAMYGPTPMGGGEARTRQCMGVGVAKLYHI